MKVCSVDGCAKAMRARGLCSTHYNQQHQPRQHAARQTTCVVCGTQVMRPNTSSRKPTCSTRCRTIVQFGTRASQDGYDWTSDAMRRARLAGATVIEPVDRFDVFARDRWTCYLCDVALDPCADPFDPLSATVDHVIPLSRGGEHTMANVRCACLGCNSRKQDRAA